MCTFPCSLWCCTPMKLQRLITKLPNKSTNFSRFQKAKFLQQFRWVQGDTACWSQRGWRHLAGVVTNLRECQWLSPWLHALTHILWIMKWKIYMYYFPSLLIVLQIFFPLPIEAGLPDCFRTMSWLLDTFPDLLTFIKRQYPSWTVSQFKSAVNFAREKHPYTHVCLRAI